MSRCVAHANAETQQINQESTILSQQRDRIAVRKVLLSAFESSFVLPPEKVAHLTSSAKPVDVEFFKILDRVKTIHRNCQTLLTTENQQNGLDIMATMSQYLDQGYEKLFFSVQADLRKLGSSQMPRQLRQSMTILAERPNMLRSVLTGLAESKQKALTAQFLSALTEESRHSKPIDFYAYDALRYVGDIFAWIHSAVVNERENLLWKEGTGDHSNGQGSSAESASSLETEAFTLSSPDALLDQITSGLAKPLKSRVDQVISTRPQVTTLYQLVAVIRFYQSTYKKLLPSSSVIVSTLEKLEQHCLRQVDVALQARISDIKERMLIPTADLQPPDFMVDSLLDLKAVLTSYETSVSYTPGRNDTLRKIIEDLTEPYIECCNRIASDMPDTDAEIFVINCLDSVKGTLQMFMSTQYKIEQLDNRIQELSTVLADRQYKHFASLSGLDHAVKALNIQSRDPKAQNIEDLPEFTKDALAELTFTLDDFLPSAAMEAQSFLYKISSPRLASTITHQASSRFASEFGRIEAVVASIYGDDTKLFFPRSLQEIRVLLALSDEEEVNQANTNADTITNTGI